MKGSQTDLTVEQIWYVHILQPQSKSLEKQSRKQKEINPPT